VLELHPRAAADPADFLLGYRLAQVECRFLPGLVVTFFAAAEATVSGDLIFVKPRFEIYKAVSQLRRAQATIEPLSLDATYLDGTENLQWIPLRDVALAIRANGRGFAKAILKQIGSSMFNTPNERQRQLEGTLNGAVRRRRATYKQSELSAVLSRDSDRVRSMFGKANYPPPYPMAPQYHSSDVGSSFSKIISAS
jgi:hypothetical protein